MRNLATLLFVVLIYSCSGPETIEKPRRLRKSEKNESPIIAEAKVESIKTPRLFDVERTRCENNTKWFYYKTKEKFDPQKKQISSLNMRFRLYNSAVEQSEPFETELECYRAKKNTDQAYRQQLKVEDCVKGYIGKENVEIEIWSAEAICGKNPGFGNSTCRFQFSTKDSCEKAFITPKNYVENKGTPSEKRFKIDPQSEMKFVGSCKKEKYIFCKPGDNGYLLPELDDVDISP